MIPTVATSAEAAKVRREKRLQELVDQETRRRRVEAVLPWAIAIGALVLWEVVCIGLKVPVFVLPPPSAVFASIVKWWPQLLSNAGQTLMTTLAGFALAIVVGVILGVIVGSYRTLYKGVYPLLIGFESIPKVAVVPLLVIWFGIGTVPAIITSFLIAFFPIMVNVSAGIASVETELRDVLRSLGASTFDIVMKVGIPRALPYFFASLKVAMTVSFVGSIIAETVGSNNGIGHLIIVAGSRFDVPLMFAGLIVTSAMGVVMYAIALLVERRALAWARD